MTSIDNYIKFALNIEDDNVDFFKVSLGKYRNHNAKFYHAIVRLLVYSSEHMAMHILQPAILL